MYIILTCETRATREELINSIGCDDTGLSRVHGFEPPRPGATTKAACEINSRVMKAIMGVSEGADVLTPEAQHVASEITSMSCGIDHAKRA
jgi:hypothetical protein